MPKNPINRRDFIRLGTGTVALGGIPVSKTLEGSSLTGVKEKGSETWTIRNRYLKIALGKEANGGLTSLVDLKSGREFISQRPRPLYELLLFRAGKDLRTVSSLDATEVRVDRSSSEAAEKLTLTYAQHASLDLQVVCSLTLGSDSPLSRWRISIRNNSGYGVRAIRFPVVVAPLAQGDVKRTNKYVWGLWGGAFIDEPGSDRESDQRLPDRANFRADGGRGPDQIPIQYPGPVSVQLQAYYDDLAGLYMATHDGGGNTKSFGLSRLTDGLDLSIEHNYDERSNFNFELPYDTVLGVFQGDWYAAADIYKAWARDQHWCAKTIAQRGDLPEWLMEPRPWPAVCSRGNYARLEGELAYTPAEWPVDRFWPASKVVPLMREYSALFDTPVVTWMEGWEYIGSPGGPADIFPPFEGEESFKAAMADLTRDGNHPFMYLAGITWCYKRAMTGYDDWPRFEREGREMAALDDHGELMISDLVHRPFMNGQKYCVALCTASQAMQDLWMKNFLHLMDLGAVALQMDQQHGFFAQVCYSDQHAHAPGYGPWMYQRTLEFIRRIRGEARKRNPLATLSVEEPCELWIQELDLFFTRPYNVSKIPLFEYLYHEYGPVYGGDDGMGLCHPQVAQMKHAATLVCGLQNCVGIGEEEYKFEVNPRYPVLTLLRSICEAQRTFAREYLVSGRMLRPPKLQVATTRVDLYLRPGFVEIPRIMHSAWRGTSDRTAYVLVNWTTHAEAATLSLIENGNREASREFQFVTGSRRTAIPHSQVQLGKIEVTIPPLTVALVEQG